eukprot:2156511-Alexandrium_andersonii.AAC.1
MFSERARILACRPAWELAWTQRASCRPTRVPLPFLLRFLVRCALTSLTSSGICRLRSMGAGASTGRL